MSSRRSTNLKLEFSLIDFRDPEVRSTLNGIAALEGDCFLLWNSSSAAMTPQEYEIGEPLFQLFDLNTSKWNPIAMIL